LIAPSVFSNVNSITREVGKKCIFIIIYQNKWGSSLAKNLYYSLLFCL
jgi:hypothetical protein